MNQEAVRERVNVSDPVGVRKLLRLGREKLRLFDIEGYEGAVVYFLQAVEAAPGFAPARASLAETYAYWGFRRELDGAACETYYALAQEQAAATLRQAPERADAHRAMAVALRRGKKGDPERRKAESLVALDLDPKDGENWYEYWRAFGYNLADSSVQRALELEPELAAIHIDLGAVLCEEGRLQEAAQQLLRALKICPRNSLAYYDLAMVLDRQGRRGPAKDALRAAEKMHPGNPLIAAGLNYLGEKPDGTRK